MRFRLRRAVDAEHQVQGEPELDEVTERDITEQFNWPLQGHLRLLSARISSRCSCRDPAFGLDISGTGGHHRLSS